MRSSSRSSGTLSIRRRGRPARKFVIVVRCRPARFRVRDRRRRDHPSSNRAGVGRIGRLPLATSRRNRRRRLTRQRMQSPAVVAAARRADEAASERAGALTIASNTGCTIGRRTADDLEDIGRRRLLLERLLRLVEEARVAQRDHRLAARPARNCRSRSSNSWPPVRQTAIAPSTAPSATSGTTIRRSSCWRAVPGICTPRGSASRVVDELGLAALHDAADDARAAFDHHGLDRRRRYRRPRRSRGRSWFPGPARRSRCCRPAAGPSRGRRCGPSRWRGPATTTGRARPRPAPKTRARGAAFLEQARVFERDAHRRRHGAEKLTSASL